MRNEFVSSFLELAKADESILFLTGDLGYMALEPVRDALGKRFINAGVAEQNMISTAAGLASKGFQPWVYSIAPFAVFRPYEQIRVDVCFHKLPVRIVGNGGGFGYGIMGSTHHAIEDVGAMRLLPGMTVYVPCFAKDVETFVQEASRCCGPVYLRLGRPVPGIRSEGSTVWSKIRSGDQGVIVTSGPITKNLLAALDSIPENCDVFLVSRFPMGEIPSFLIERINQTGKLITIEEHVRAGGLGEELSNLLMGKLSRAIQYLPLFAEGYPSGRYGSQEWHLADNGLTGAKLSSRIHEFLNTSMSSWE